MLCLCMVPTLAAEAPATGCTWELRTHLNFENADIGQAPADLFILDGDFMVTKIEENRVLALAGEPLGEFGVLFGRRKSSEVRLRARIRSRSLSRQLPSFGIGLNGRSGFRLTVAAGAHVVRLHTGNEILASTRYHWQSERWTWLELSVEQISATSWHVCAKVWEHGVTEPVDSILAWTTTRQPSTGRPSMWGIPYAGQPIFFDDLSVFTK